MKKAYERTHERTHAERPFILQPPFHVLESVHTYQTMQTPFILSQHSKPTTEQTVSNDMKGVIRPFIPPFINTYFLS